MCPPCTRRPPSGASALEAAAEIYPDTGGVMRRICVYPRVGTDAGPASDLKPGPLVPIERA